MRTQKNRKKLPAALLTLLLIFTTTATFAQSAKVVTMKGTNQLRFTVEHIEASPGQKITVKLTNDTTLPANAMSHDFVLLKQSTDPKAFATTAAKYKDQDYVAPGSKDQIIARTDMASGGQTVEVTFNAPKKPGDYTYICTFPGHYLAGMKGTLTVK